MNSDSSSVGVVRHLIIDKRFRCKRAGEVVATQAITQGGLAGGKYVKTGLSTLLGHC